MAVYRLGVGMILLRPGLGSAVGRRGCPDLRRRCAGRRETHSRSLCIRRVLPGGHGFSSPGCGRLPSLFATCGAGLGFDDGAKLSFSVSEGFLCLGDGSLGETGLFPGSLDGFLGLLSPAFGQAHLFLGGLPLTLGLGESDAGSVHLVDQWLRGAGEFRCLHGRTVVRDFGCRAGFIARAKEPYHGSTQFEGLILSTLTD